MANPALCEQVGPRSHGDRDIYRRVTHTY